MRHNLPVFPPSDECRGIWCDRRSIAELVGYIVIAAIFITALITGLTN